MLQLRHDASHPGIRIIAPGFVFGEMLFAQAQRRKFVQDRVLVGAKRIGISTPLLESSGHIGLG